MSKYTIKVQVPSCNFCITSDTHELTPEQYNDFKTFLYDTEELTTIRFKKNGNDVILREDLIKGAVITLQKHLEMD